MRATATTTSKVDWQRLYFFEVAIKEPEHLPLEGNRQTTNHSRRKGRTRQQEPCSPGMPQSAASSRSLKQRAKRAFCAAPGTVVTTSQPKPNPNQLHRHGRVQVANNGATRS